MTRHKERNKTAKIEAIRDAAMTLFRTQGYPSTTTNQIAAQAGVSIGLLYKYFPSGKPEIARKTIENLREQIISEELRNMTLEEAPTVLPKVLLRFIGGHRQVSANLAAFEMASFEDAETAEMGKQVYTIGRDSLLTVLRELTGRKGNDSLVMWASLIFHIIDSVVHRQVLHEALMMSDEKLADLLAQVMTRSIAAIREE